MERDRGHWVHRGEVLILERVKDYKEPFRENIWTQSWRMSMGFSGEPGEEAVFQAVGRTCDLVNKRRNKWRDRRGHTGNKPKWSATGSSIAWVSVDGGGCSEPLVTPCAVHIAKRPPGTTKIGGMSRKKFQADTSHLSTSRRRKRNNLQCGFNLFGDVKTLQRTSSSNVTYMFQGMHGMKAIFLPSRIHKCMLVQSREHC